MLKERRNGFEITPQPSLPLLVFFLWPMAYDYVYKMIFQRYRCVNTLISNFILRKKLVKCRQIPKKLLSHIPIEYLLNLFWLHCAFVNSICIKFILLSLNIGLSLGSNFHESLWIKNCFFKWLQADLSLNFTFSTSSRTSNVGRNCVIHPHN